MTISLVVILFVSLFAAVYSLGLWLIDRHSPDGQIEEEQP